MFSTKSELYRSKRKSFDFRLTSVAQKRLCLSSLLFQPVCELQCKLAISLEKSAAEAIAVYLLKLLLLSWKKSDKKYCAVLELVFLGVKDILSHARKEGSWFLLALSPTVFFRWELIIHC